MNYSLIRPLIYRERKKLEEFNVFNGHKKFIVNAFLYDRLLKIDYLHPKHDYATEETRRIFNDVHFFMTLFFLDENPLAHYADYRKIPNPNQQKDDLSQHRTVVELSMIYVILQCWHKTDWFKQKFNHDKFFEVLSGEIEKIVSNNHITDDTNIAKTLISESFYYRFTMYIDRDFAPRNIQEVVDGKESLKDCLAVGKDISEAVNLLCKDNTQKLGLIARLLEPEEEGYGAFSAPIPDAYRSLHELRSELTGQPLPAKLPFEKFKFPAPPMMGTPPELLEPVEKDDETEKMQARINELKKQLKKAQEEKLRLQQEYEQKLSDAKTQKQELEKKVEELQKQRSTAVEEMTIELFTPLFNSEETARAFYKDIYGKDDPDIADVVVSYKDKFGAKVKNRDIYRPMHAAKIYQGIDKNFDAALRDRGFRGPLK